jgi:hypothetical protein
MDAQIRLKFKDSYSGRVYFLTPIFNGSVFGCMFRNNKFQKLYPETNLFEVQLIIF